jgi:hypothetical protein
LLVVSAAAGGFGWYMFATRAQRALESVPPLPSALPPIPVPTLEPVPQPTAPTGTPPSSGTIAAPGTAVTPPSTTTTPRPSTGGASGTAAGGASASNAGAATGGASTGVGGAAAPSVSATCARAIACCKTLMAKAPAVPANCESVPTINDQICQQQLDAFRQAGSVFGVTCP